MKALRIAAMSGMDAHEHGPGWAGAAGLGGGAIDALTETERGDRSERFGEADGEGVWAGAGEPDGVRTLEGLSTYAADDGRFGRAAAAVAMSLFGRSGEVAGVAVFAGGRLVASEPERYVEEDGGAGELRAEGGGSGPGWLGRARELVSRAAANDAVLEAELVAPGGGVGGDAGEAGTAGRVVMVAGLLDEAGGGGVDESRERVEPLGLAAVVRVGSEVGGSELRQRLVMLRQARGRAKAERLLRVAELRLARAGRAVEVLAAFHAETRLASAGAALVNELAAALDADRVSLGVIEGGTARVIAMSHVEKFVRKQDVVGEIESAMEEAADQDADIAHAGASGDGARSERVARARAGVVDRAHAHLASGEGGASVLSVPLRRGGEVVGVLTSERGGDQPFGVGALALVRLTAELSAARLVELRAMDRWVGAKAWAEVRRSASGLVGPRHTGWKLAAVVLSVLLIAGLVVPVPRAASGSFVLEAAEERAVSAPFDGFVEEVLVGEDERVGAGAVLARMRSTELALELAALEREAAASRAEAARARSAGDAAAAEIAGSQAEEAEARAALARERLRTAEVRSPIGGVVLTDEPGRLEGRSARRGEVLMRVAEVADLYAEVGVDEGMASEVVVGMEVALAPASDPTRTVRGTVRRVGASAEARGGRNVVPVEVELVGENGAETVRAGMSGVARVKLGSGPALAVWTEELRDWVRLRAFRLW